MTQLERDQIEKLTAALNDMAACVKAQGEKIDAMHDALMVKAAGHDEPLIDWLARLRIASKGGRQIVATVIKAAAFVGAVSAILAALRFWLTHRG